MLGIISAGVLSTLIVVVTSCPDHFVYNSNYDHCAAVLPEKQCTKFDNHSYSAPLCLVPKNSGGKLDDSFFCNNLATFKICNDSPGHCCMNSTEAECNNYYYTAYSSKLGICKISIITASYRGKENITCPEYFSYDDNKSLCAANISDVDCETYNGSVEKDDECLIAGSQKPPRMTCNNSFKNVLGVCQKEAPCNDGIEIGLKCFPYQGNLKPIPTTPATTSAPTPSPSDNSSYPIYHFCPETFLVTEKGCVRGKMLDCETKYHGYIENDLCIVKPQQCPLNFAVLDYACVGKVSITTCSSVNGTFDTTHQVCIVSPSTLNVTENMNSQNNNDQVGSRVKRNTCVDTASNCSEMLNFCTSSTWYSSLSQQCMKTCGFCR